MSSADIQDFAFDDENEDKLHRHGLSARRVRQILDGMYVVVRNKGAARGEYLVIGRDHGGAAITVSIEATNDPKIWRPVTGWPSAKHEIARLV